MNQIFDEDIKGSKTEAIIEVLRRRLSKPPQRILVVGCGSGHEAGMLARAFEADTVGIDLATEFELDHAGSAPARLMTMDARILEFSDASFDLVFSFHALEHIPEPKRALSEMARVLRSQGTFLVGAPNRSRMLGYFGAPHPLRYRIWWNFVDMWMRLTGRWTNEAGAHAGFSAADLCAQCASAFGQAESITDAYYRTLYSSRAHLVDLLIKSRLKDVLYPCVYITGMKR